MGRIKILFLQEKLACGGTEQALYDLACLMDKTKFDITILPLTEGGEWEEKFREAGLHVDSVWSCQKKTKNPWIKLDNWRKRKKIKHSLKNDYKGIIETCYGNQFDIIVAYKVWGNHEFIFGNNAKTIKYIHSDLETNSYERQDILRMKECIDKFDRFICVSHRAKTSFESVTGISKNAVVHFNPLNDENIRELSKAEIRTDENLKTICAVGRLSFEKGFDRLIRIHKKLCDEGYKHRLIIVGEGHMREMLETTIRSIHCEDSVTLAGYSANPYPYMKNSEFIVCSSYTEGLPVIAMEALSLGVPIVSAVPSIGELFGGETCGIITENDDAGLENGIRKMLSDQVFFETAKSGAEKRREYFNGKRMVQEIEQEFIELLNTEHVE